MKVHAQSKPWLWILAAVFAFCYFMTGSALTVSQEWLG